MANDIQSRRLGKLRPVKERNQRVRRSKPATRQLEKHAQGRLIYSLCHTAGEGGGEKKKKKNSTTCLGREGGVLTP